MKSIITLLPLCLWQMASGTPIPPRNSTDLIHKLPHFEHTVESVTYPRASAENIQALTRKARAGLIGSTLATRNVTILDHNLLGSHLFARVESNLKSNCKLNTSTYVDTTRLTSPLAADCSALVEQLLHDYPNNGTCVSFGFAPNNNNSNNNNNTASSKTTTNLLVSSGSCGFSMTVETAALSSTSVGVGDVVSVIQEAVRRFTIDYAVTKEAEEDDKRDNNDNNDNDVDDNKENSKGVANGTVGPPNSTGNARIGGAGAFECGGNGTSPGTFVNWAVAHT
ncbi:hypothetical protein F4774DRAFT_382484 [Daldinia eschscholtzii]|nr:hypothetical protein F4774DRAFT_382484 [Daldinia eschscholtzii]